MSSSPEAEPTVAISAIEHWEYCPRQCALIHADGVWADNEHTVRGERAHRRADSGRHRVERGRRVLRSIPLWSERLGLSGRADVVEVTSDGRLVPVEYKSGTRHGDAAHLQLCAQALCLEEMLDVAVDEGALWFGGPRRRVAVRFDDQLRSRTVTTIEAIREVLVRGGLPGAPADERCTSCQLQGHCLPQVVSRPELVTRYVTDEVFGCGC